VAIHFGNVGLRRHDVRPSTCWSSTARIYAPFPLSSPGGLHTICKPPRPRFRLHLSPSSVLSAFEPNSRRCGHPRRLVRTVLGAEALCLNDAICTPPTRIPWRFILVMLDSREKNPWVSGTLFWVVVGQVKSLVSSEIASMSHCPGF
jgi:hypothetical protein